MGYRLIDHTADTGIALEAPTRSELFRQAALALFDQVVDRSTVVYERRVDVAVSGDDDAELLFNWLRELLYLWNGRGMLVRSVDIADIGPTTLAAQAAGEAFDGRRHAIRAEIKAVTYHRLTVAGDDVTGWSAGFIRVPEAMGAYLPVAALLMLLLIPGAGNLYHWAHPGVMDHDILLEHKAPYLNLPFWTVRMVLFLSLWIVMAWLLSQPFPLFIISILSCFSLFSRSNLHALIRLCLM